MRYFLILLIIVSTVTVSGIGYLHFFHKQNIDKPEEMSEAIKSVSTVSVASLLDETKKFALSVIDERLSSTTEVLSIQEQAGDVRLIAGDGLSVSSLNLTNDDKGSSQNIFKNIEIGSDTITAGSNNDILRVAGGNGISITTDTKSKKLTISSIVSPTIFSNSFSDITSGSSSGALVISPTGSLTYYNGSSIPGSINANFLQGQTWSSPAVIGNITPADAIFSNLTVNGIAEFPDLSSGIAQINSSGQLISSSLNLSGNYLTGNLPLVLGGTGATTSAQVRSNLGLGSLALENINTKSLTNYLQLSGGTLTGNLSINGNLNTGLSQGIAQINSLGQLISSSLNLSGNNLTGILPLYLGGTGASTSSQLRDSLNLGSLALQNTDTTSLTKYLPLSGGALTGGLSVANSLNVYGITTDNKSGNINASNGYVYARGVFDENTTISGIYMGYGPKNDSPRFLLTNGNASQNFQIDNYSGNMRFFAPYNIIMELGTNFIITHKPISTSGNNNLKIVPGGNGYTVIGDAGTTSHSLNTNDDIFVTGRLEVNGQSYFDNHLLVGGASLCVKSTSSACAGNTAGTLYASNTTVQSADVAENYISSQQLESGDLVMPDKSSDQAVLKTTAKNQSSVIGIVSSNPGVTLNSDAKTDGAHPYLYPIALSGRVPVKVSTENGSISVGDLLTTSSIPGVAMKATKNGAFIGKALQEYNGSGVGKIMVFVTLSSALPSDIALESPSGNTSYDLALLQSQISSLSAQLLNIPDISQILPRITLLESRVASLSSEKILTSSSGEGMIKKGETEVKIAINNLSDSSRILITPTSMTDRPLIVKEKDPGDFFTVGIVSSSSADISFDWLVINK